jgi:hypothetical protein
MSFGRSRGVLGAWPLVAAAGQVHAVVGRSVAAEDGLPDWGASGEGELERGYASGEDRSGDRAGLDRGEGAGS